METNVLGLVGAAALPALLLAVFGIFRWRYVRLIARTIRSGPTAPIDPVEPTSNLDDQPRVAFEVDASRGPASDCADAARATAVRESAALRRAFLIGSLVYTVAGAAVVYLGQSTVTTPRAALVLAFFSTLPSLYVAVAFTRARARTRLIAAVAWLFAGFLLLTVGLRIPWRVALGIIADGITFAAFALVCVIPLTLRTTRGLLVGFVPLLGLWCAISTMVILGTAALGLDFVGGITLRSSLLGLIATGLGMSIAVREIRRGAVRRVVVLLASMFVIGALATWLTNFSDATAVVAGVGFNGLMTIVVWWAFGGFLRLKSRGILPDEVLHVALCWLTLTAFLAIFSRTESASQIPQLLLPVTLAVAALFLLLQRARHRRPAVEHKRMLLLRVFGEPAVRRRLLDVLGDSWRHVGSIDIVVGVDVAVHTLGAVALQDFLLGRIDRLIVTSSADVEARGRATLKAAVDGRYAINEFLCLANVWQAVVDRLVDSADVVLMDLRGFSADNRGAAFELGLTVQRVRLSKLVLMMDGTTDATQVARIVHGAWARLPPTSPNRGDPSPRIVVVGNHDRFDVSSGVVPRVFDAAFGPDVVRQAPR